MRSGPLLIDFTMPPAGAAALAHEEKTEAETKARKTGFVQPAQKARPPLKQVKPVPAAAPTASGAPMPSTAMSLTSKNAGQGAATGAAARSEGSEAVGARHPGGALKKQGDGTAKQAYIRENFAYIRDIIMKNLSYPRIAREMGWSGKVVVTFLVLEDGAVKDIKIVRSSGFGILDKSAVETIKKSCPFPRPPAAAQLKVPIEFRLGQEDGA